MVCYDMICQIPPMFSNVFISPRLFILFTDLACGTKLIVLSTRFYVLFEQQLQKQQQFIQVIMITLRKNETCTIYNKKKDYYQLE